MKKQIYVLTLLLSVLFSQLAMAAENTAVTGNLPLLPETHPDATTQKRFSSANTDLVHDLCPATESLVRNDRTQTWSAPNGWTTTSPSFLRNVDSFLGAQWVGVGIGEIICIYTKGGRSTFPVTLQRGRLVPAPAGEGLWSEDKGGYMECKTADFKQCPFFVQVPKKGENVYDQLDFYKGKPVETDR